jgi:Protein of unknown function (DUF4054)
MITSDQFRANFVAFQNTSIYPDSMIDFWLQFAYIFISPTLWGTVVDLGAQLFVAHNLTLEGLSNAEGGNGAPPGMTSGPIVTKTVGELTITYDPSSGVNPDDTSWNLTNYGSRFVKLAKQFGSIPTQLGIGRTPLFNGPAWPGVIYTDTWT